MGAYHVCYYGFSFLQKAPRGKIINFAGGGATSAFPCYSGYATSKIALVKLTENMSIEYPSMDINCIAPGFINTPLANQTLAAGDKAGSFYEITLQMINERGGVDVKYAVELVQFLLCEKSNGITSAPASASGRLDDPVPAAISRIRIPGFGEIIEVATLRQAFVRPRLSKSFSKS